MAYNAAHRVHFLQLKYICEQCVLCFGCPLPLPTQHTMTSHNYSKGFNCSMHEKT